jgi:hypothetical protein
VDRIFYDLDLPQGLPIVIYGNISNQPGPYQVTINSSFDTQAQENHKTPVSATHVNLVDDLGVNEELQQVTAGVYQTSPTGIQGRIGGVYKLRVELQDGRIYESTPDTLLSAGTIDTLYHTFKSKPNSSGQTHYGFDVTIDSHGNEKNKARYMWNFTGTFKAITHPELMRNPACYPLPEEHIICNTLPPCTGLRNNSPSPSQGVNFIRVAPCTCCMCWYQIFNNSPILSDEIFNSNGSYLALPIYTVPLNEWIFMFKIHAEVTQSALTKNSFRFFKSIRDQKLALGSLFQPITGKIPTTFIQLEGSTGTVNGIFYAAGISSKKIYITPEDVHPPVQVPIVHFEYGVGAVSCLELFPNATIVKPAFWID